MRCDAYGYTYINTYTHTYIHTYRYKDRRTRHRERRDYRGAHESATAVFDSIRFDTIHTEIYRYIKSIKIYRYTVTSVQ
jgi:hypothetical protein